MLGDIADGVDDVGKAAHGAVRPGRVLAEARPVGRLDEPQHQRQVEHRVEQDAVRGAEREHDDAAHGRADQHADIARRRVEPHRAHEVGRADDVIEQELVRRLPQHAGAAMDHQQHHRVPHLKGAGDEEIPPAERGQDEQAHAALNEAARVEPVRQRAGGDREHQEREPVRQHRKPGQRRRVELLIQHPVADHVLDIVGHHRQHVGRELDLKAAIAERRERAVRGGRGAARRGTHVVHQQNTSELNGSACGRDR